MKIIPHLVKYWVIVTIWWNSINIKTENEYCITKYIKIFNFTGCNVIVFHPSVPFHVETSHMICTTIILTIWMWFNTNLSTLLFQKIESVQYNAVLAIMWIIKGSTREKQYQELGLECLYQRRWVKRLRSLYKCFSSGQPTYVYYLLPPKRSSHQYVNLVNTVSCRSEDFKTSLIPNVSS